MLLDLLDMSWQSRSSDENQAQLINMYLEEDVAKGKYKVSAYPMPGLTLFCDTLQANVRELYALNNQLYGIAGNQFYKINSDGTFSSLGTLTTSSGFAKIKAITGGVDTNHQLCAIDGTNGYAYNVGTSTATFPISDANFPQTANDIENQDDYILVSKLNSMTFQQSNVSDVTTWNALNFASKFGQPDNIEGLLSHEGNIWLFGNKTSEIWYNAGNAQGVVFSKNPSTFLHYGLAAKRSIAVNGNYFIFLSANRGGGLSVFQTLPRIYYYNPAPVSTPPIDYILNSASTVSDAIADIANIDGHEFYTLTLPTANQTLVYDVPKTQQADSAKGAWYYRQSYVNSSYGRFLGNCAAYCYGKHLVGDYQSGKIYYLDHNNYTENNTPILRQFVTPPGPTYAGGKRVFFGHLQIDIETGVGSNETFTLEKSTDNGNSWTLVNTFTVPAKGGRIYQSRVGSSRYGMIFRISTTMNAKFCILGFQCDMQVGSS